jgi:Co/Zn/Cd efflux system component
MSTATAAAELSVAADHVENYRARVAALVLPLQGGNHDDVVAAMFEAERALRSAGRSLDRAVRLLNRTS